MNEQQKQAAIELLREQLQAFEDIENMVLAHGGEELTPEQVVARVQLLANRPVEKISMTVVRLKKMGKCGVVVAKIPQTHMQKFEYRVMVQGDDGRSWTASFWEDEVEVLQDG